MQLVAHFLHIDIQSPSNGDLFVACLLEIFCGHDDSNQKGYSMVQLGGRSPHCEIACRATASLGFGASGTMTSMGELLISSKWMNRYELVRQWNNNSHDSLESQLWKTPITVETDGTVFSRRVYGKVLASPSIWVRSWMACGSLYIYIDTNSKPHVPCSGFNNGDRAALGKKMKICQPEHLHSGILAY